MDYYKLKILNNKRKIIIVSATFLVTIGILLYYFFYYQDSDEPLLSSNLEVKEDITNDNSDLSGKTIVVDIKGFVEKPGVYTFKVEDDARVNDLILKAGGLKKEADTSILNLSKKLEDEMTIVIYSQQEVKDYVNSKNELQSKLELCELKIKNNACIIESSNNTSTDNNKSLVNINTASKEELMSLPGIGEAKAKAIINYRSGKSFKSIDEIKNVDGIGDSLFESIKEYIKV